MRPKRALKVLEGRTILGIDPSSNHLAVVTMTAQGYRFDKFSLGKGKFEARKAHRAYVNLSMLLESIPLSPSGDRYAWIERSIIANSRNFYGSIVQAYASGAIQAALGQHNFQVGFVSPSQWKKVVCGHGHATKEDVAAVVQLRWPALHRRACLDQDVLDAAAIAIYGGIKVCGRSFMAT